MVGAGLVVGGPSVWQLESWPSCCGRVGVGSSVGPKIFDPRNFQQGSSEGGRLWFWSIASVPSHHPKLVAALRWHMVRPGEGRRRCGPGLALSADVEQLLVLSQLIVDSCDHVGGWVNGCQNHGRVVFSHFWMVLRNYIESAKVNQVGGPNTPPGRSVSNLCFWWAPVRRWGPRGSFGKVGWWWADHGQGDGDGYVSVVLLLLVVVVVVLVS